MAKKKAVRKPRKTVEKVRGGGTLTEAAFWGMIRSTLRNKSRFWKPINDCKLRAKRPYKGARKLQKWEYLCANCGSYYPNTQINVDHIVPAGQLNSYDDLPGFVERLFCEVDGLQVLCSNCHDEKTAKEKKVKKTK